jgi:EF-P beta-lysylation protein EpmB
MKTNIVATKSESVRAGCSEIGGFPVKKSANWREALKNAIRCGADLISILKLEKHFTYSPAAEQDFPVFVPWEYLSRMEVGNPADPLVRQVLALPAETALHTTASDDPVGDAHSTLSPGLIRKYQSRALLVTTGACAVHCRYCFRRHFPYEQSPRSLEQWQPALEAIRASPEIDEVILSGGDPLTIVDEQLELLTAAIASIPHVRRLRIHTRVPIVVPQRVTQELLNWLRTTRLAPIMVVHVNHANELDEATSQALTQLVDAGVPVLNQTVLLRGVNDDVASLVNLSRRLVDLRVMPYYLHQLDRVRGAVHFEVPIGKGLVLIEQMRAQLPGYAIPRYVQEIAGEDSKRVLA